MDRKVASKLMILGLCMTLTGCGAIQKGYNAGYALGTANRYKKLKEYDKAEVEYKKGYDIADDGPLLATRASLAAGLADLYRREKKYDQAKEKFDEALKDFEAAPDASGEFVKKKKKLCLEDYKVFLEETGKTAEADKLQID